MTTATTAAGALAEVAADAWDALLEELGVADVYLQRHYVEAACLLEPGRPVLLHLAARGGDVVFPCILRDLPGASECRDVTTPYGYGGPAVAGEDPPAAAFNALYERWCRENRVVTTFVRYHPLLGNHRHAPPVARLERLADTATWPLPAGLDLFAGMHSMHRRGCRKAVASGVEVHVERAPASLDTFVALYEDTMHRRGAESFYFFPDAYWEALAARLRDRLVRLDALAGRELVASMLVFATPPWLHYHLGATSGHGRELGASKLLFLEAARYGQTNGFAELHLGSGLGGSEDSLWRFKHRFAPGASREFWIGKLVHDSAAYRELTGGRGDEDGFFPAYRAGR